MGYLSFLIVFMLIMSPGISAQESDGGNDPGIIAEENLLAPTPTVTPLPEEVPNWIDTIYNETGLFIQNQVTNTDLLFAENPDNAITVTNSTFRLGVYLQYEEDDSRGGIKFDPDFHADLVLPNIERRFNVFITGRDLDDLPGTDPSEGDSSNVFMGLKKKFSYISTSVGIKVDWPPVLFGNLKIRKLFKFPKGHIYPQQRIYYRTDDGFGEVTSIQLDYWFHENFLTRWDSGVKWTEISTGVEWEESISFAFIREGDLDFLKQAVGFRYSIFGHKVGAFLIDRHRVSLMYRCPIYKKWMYLEVIPEVVFENEFDWNADFGTRIGVDIMFTGVYK